VRTQPCVAQQRSRSRAPAHRQGPRQRVVAAAGSGDGSLQPWWGVLPKIYLLAFDLGDDREAVYTISERQGEEVKNNILAFASSKDAELAMRAVATQTGLTPYVEGVTPGGLVQLCGEAGYGCEVVPEGADWLLPSATVDMTKYEDEDGELAISTEDLSKFLQTDAGVAPEELVALSEAPLSEAEAEEIARREAALAVRGALLMPLTRLSAAANEAAGVQTERAGALGPLPRAPAAVHRAVLAIAAQRMAALLPTEDDDA